MYWHVMISLTITKFQALSIVVFSDFSIHKFWGLLRRHGHIMMLNCPLHKIHAPSGKCSTSWKGETGKLVQDSVSFVSGDHHLFKVRRKKREVPRSLFSPSNALAVGRSPIGLRNKVARWQNLIPSFPWIAPGWRAGGRNPRKGRDQILPSGNHSSVA